MRFDNNDEKMVFVFLCLLVGIVCIMIGMTIMYYI